jgi:hypothetical protein
MHEDEAAARRYARPEASGYLLAVAQWTRILIDNGLGAPWVDEVRAHVAAVIDSTDDDELYARIEAIQAILAVHRYVESPAPTAPKLIN